MAHLLENKEVWPSSRKQERVMTMVIFFPFSVESCQGDNRRSSRKAECPSSPMAMAYLQEKKEVCSSYS